MKLESSATSSASGKSGKSGNENGNKATQQLTSIPTQLSLCRQSKPEQNLCASVRLVASLKDCLKTLNDNYDALISIQGTAATATEAKEIKRPVSCSRSKIKLKS